MYLFGDTIRPTTLTHILVEENEEKTYVCSLLDGNKWYAKGKGGKGAGIRGDGLCSSKWDA